MGVTVHSDKRFRRNQARPSRRRRLRRGPWWSVVRGLVMLGALAYGGYRTSVWALETGWLRVQHVNLSGNERLSRGELLGLLDGLKGQSILLTRVDRWRERVLASPWVADATVRRRLPSTIEVVVRERHPIGIARLRDELYLIDAGGTVIDEFGPRYAEFDLPIIDGLVSVTADGEPAIDRGRSDLVARVLASIRSRPSLMARVSQIDVTEPQDVHVILDGDPAVVRLGNDRFAERLQSFIELAPAFRQHVPDIDYVDLRFDDRIAVRPASSGKPAPDGVVKPPAS
jgi:cell division protein FtsQ